MRSAECGRYRLDEVQTALALLQGMADGAPAAGLGLGPGLSPSTFFAGRLDTRCTAIGGHSYGGATAVATAATDTRIRACVTLDPWWCAGKSMEWASAFHPRMGKGKSNWGLEAARSRRERVQGQDTRGDTHLHELVMNRQVGAGESCRQPHVCTLPATMFRNEQKLLVLASRAPCVRAGARCRLPRPRWAPGATARRCWCWAATRGTCPTRLAGWHAGRSARRGCCRAQPAGASADRRACSL